MINIGKKLCNGCNLLGKLPKVQPDSSPILAQLQLDRSHDQEGLLHVLVRDEHIGDLFTGIHLINGFQHKSQIEHKYHCFSYMSAPSGPTSNP